MARTRTTWTLFLSWWLLLWTGISRHVMVLIVPPLSSLLAEAFVLPPSLSSASSRKRPQDDPLLHSRPFFPTLPMAANGDNNNNNNNNDSSASALTKDEIARYSRHLVLADVGMKGQATLKQSSVLVIGAGGLGSPCLMYLAAAGVGHIGLVDADTVDASNLQRQVIHGTSTVGMSKCQSAAQRIRDINPHVYVRLYECEFTAESALKIVQEGFFAAAAATSSSVAGSDSDDETWSRVSSRPYDIVIDGSDNFPTKYLINDVCAMLGIPWIYSAILAFEGQVSFFNLYGVGPDYRDLLPTPPPPGDVPSCAEGGVLGVLPGTMGCLQATEAIKYLLGHTDGLLSGRVLVMDAMKLKFTEVGLSRAVDRPVITELVDYQGFCAGPKTIAAAATSSSSSTIRTTTAMGRTMDEVPVEEDAVVATASLSAPTWHSLTPKECLDKMVYEGWAPWVLDVRLQTEHDIVALPFTDKVVPHRSVRPRHIPQRGDVLVYCKSGVRGKKACHRLVEQGVDPERLYNLDGGIMKWQSQVDPSMPRY